MVRIIAPLIVTLCLHGCYHVPIQQGNIIEPSAIKQLHLGASKAEVTKILGTPVLDNIFSNDIWTYAYTNQPKHNKIVKRKAILTFKNGKLSQIQQ